MKKLHTFGLAALSLLSFTFAQAADVVNLSARASVGSGEDAFAVGFTVMGEEGETVPVLALGSGPTDNVTNPIADPQISLFKHLEGEDNMVIQMNNDWMAGGQMLAISSTGIAPENSASSGLIAMLEPGAYSFHLADVTEAGGVGIAEVFEMPLQDVASSVVAANDFNTLLAALTAAQPSADLVAVLQGEGPFTLFAPTDEAFAKIPSETLDGLLADPDLLADILQYHVVAGAEVPAAAVTNSKVGMANMEEAIVQVTAAGGVIIQGANVIEADFPASNGIIHVIDSVILPPSGDENIVDVLTAAGNFSTLLGAAVATGAADTLITDGPFTLFAPTDDAFAEIADTVATLTNEQLLDVLLYHVVVGAQVNAADVSAGEVTMGNNAMATLAVGDGVTINDSNVILADLFGSNGVIHVIDKVLLPPAM